MNKKQIKDRSVFISILVASFMLCVLVYFLMNHVQYRLNSDVSINLTEIVTQNKDLVTSKLTLEINNINSIANNISSNLTDSNYTNQEYILSLLKDHTTLDDDGYVAVSDLNGNALFRDGRTIDISGRNYFKLAKKGIQNISESVVSRLDGSDLFVICTPLYYEDRIIGTVQKGYSPQQMYDICSISLYSDNGTMYIVNKDGYIVLMSDNALSKTNGEPNFYRYLYSKGNENETKQLETDIGKNKSGFFESNIDGEQFFSAYTQVEDIHDWYIITSVPISKVSPNSEIVVNLFYLILFLVVVIITSIEIVFLRYKVKQQKNLKRIAFEDPVTKGPTYNKFILEVEDILSKNNDKQYFILKFDIDNFKYINNYYGFEFGDKILYSIQNELSKLLDSDEVIARISSDQFVALLNNVSTNRLQSINDILLNINEDESIYCSAGIYIVKDKKESINLMVDKARTASQLIKGSLNKTYEFYKESYNLSSALNEQLKRAIINAIENDNFIVYYQPKVNIETKELIGCEALVRWNDNGTIISPDGFIPICEKTGIITQIDMLVYDKVLQFLKKNIEQGIPCVPISVNFSRLHLNNRDFIDTLVAFIKEYDVPPELIEIELTESAFFDNLEIIHEFIDALHDNGFKMAMDDFGSGYSSLNMVKDIPIDILKIDKEFLSSTTPQDNKQEIIFSSIVDMANKLGIKVVIEGVETKDNIDLMNKCNCSIAQGYYFSKPMQESDFEKIFKEKKL